MKNMYRVAISVLLLVLALSVVSQPAMAQSPQQVVFSGTGIGTFTLGTTTKASPFGFWIWCEGASTNPYAGACNGAMYFYAFGITRPVDGSRFQPDLHNEGPLSGPDLQLCSNQRCSNNYWPDEYGTRGLRGTGNA